MDFLSHLHVVVKHIVKLTRANNNMQMAQKRRAKQTVLIQRTSLKGQLQNCLLRQTVAS